jgi:uncharacterized membrane protein YedE/YeeE
MNMFDTNFFADPKTLLLGALTGLVFGFLLQKAHVTRFGTIVGQFLLRDFTVMKVMLTAIVVGGVGVYAMLDAGLIEGLHIKSATLLGNFLGGAIFGVGMAVLGYCPGTGVAALADGARDAIFGVLGMLVGAALYAESYPWIKENILSVADEGKVSLSDVTGASHWWFIAALAMLSLIGFRALEKWEAKRVN